MNEIWKQVVGYEGLYEVSNLGKIKSFYISKNILKNCAERDGYFVIGLNKKKKRKQFKVHRLVAQAFIPNLENKPCVNHIDNNPQNNNIFNLEWCTYKENTQHSLKQGRMVDMAKIRGETLGSKNPRALINEKQVLEIRSLVSKMKQKDIANLFLLKIKTVSAIIRRQNWKHI